MASTLSFRNVPKAIFLENNEMIDLYSKFNFLYISFQEYKKQDKINRQELIENLLFYSLEDFKLITINLSNLIDTDINAFFCAEGKFLIINRIDISAIKSLINKLRNKKITILNTGLEFDIFENGYNEKNLKKEIENFCFHFQSQINKSQFVKSTILPISGYIIRRFFYPNYYFRDSSEVRTPTLYF